MKNLFIYGFILLFMAVSCGKEEEKAETNKFGHKVTVKEVIQAEQYTYLKVDEDSKEYWIAIAKKPVEEGETLYYMEGMEMKDFESNELGRTFESIYFVQNITNTPMKEMSGVHSQMQQGQKPDIVREEIAVEPVEGGVTISDIYSEIENYKDKVLKVRGKVTVYNPEIMGRNWVHIQDGTNFSENFDLTVTTSESVQVGDVVTFVGKLSTDIDFGYGYTYKVLLENAQIVK